MKSISLRGIDEELALRLKQEAEAARKSLNQYVLETIKRHVGLEKERQFTRVYHDLDHLFGRWSDDEFNMIQGKIDGERRIDSELWR
ncbi:MAG: antitoxin [Deltaproteobacteria bacterium CG_4_8_14_3_um_filter_51_11]|nr:toxin-antitoxin system HicB family antitoxin [bacterium]OIP42903.1 MAG: antitoxin [Desulfobacteraceae bacterium CG2_30_51_40]PIP46071.1 MAG: antitoxin [Deltaproteobacteria bacterium CG23_combo_of_CG06-09_8_20_14_all_51_20]PIW01751.1 MAG: antitoxin [Deltaproteobacteria bacterium CG17_big_fil_post_rev_8_21_14_2_50_51_6]PIX20859.1 MAG: antitoxin [Deltaproteobacteria bacterium CG_4_8_14_3_um_filter_51_11]PIY26113.1 MAG: antitoxin [Deltaproteobacteria bacterium CG_4_10_14_3_um_filter_51_14]